MAEDREWLKHWRRVDLDRSIFDAEEVGFGTAKPALEARLEQLEQRHLELQQQVFLLIQQVNAILTKLISPGE